MADTEARNLVIAGLVTAVLVAAGPVLIGQGNVEAQGHHASFWWFAGGAACFVLASLTALALVVPLGPRVVRRRLDARRMSRAIAAREAAKPIFEPDPYQWTDGKATPGGPYFEKGNTVARFTLTNLGDRWARGVTFHLYDGSPPGPHLMSDGRTADSKALRQGIQVRMLLPGKTYTVDWTGSSRWDAHHHAAMYPFTTPRQFATVSGFACRAEPVGGSGLQGVRLTLASDDWREISRPSKCMVIDPRHFVFWLKAVSLDALAYEDKSFALDFPQDFEGDKLGLPLEVGPYRVEWFRPLGGGVNESFLVTGFTLDGEGSVS